MIRRLEDKGIKPRTKIRKSDHDVALCKRRVDFARRYQQYYGEQPQDTLAKGLKGRT